MGFRTYEVSGHRYVIPSDALDAVGSGRMDRRLFDITSLREFGYADTPSVPLIVSGEAMTAAKGQSWPGLQARPEKIWLDGKRKLALAESVPQVGAPVAWRSGFTGKGVTVAVLDTGIDDTHPDFAGRIVDKRDFTGKDTDDKVGHGTHVASTIAGMRWAARDKKARVVNLGLGGPDAEEIDRLEVAINELSAETGALFVVASGNSGPSAGSVSSGTRGSPAVGRGSTAPSNPRSPHRAWRSWPRWRVTATGTPSTSRTRRPVARRRPRRTSRARRHCWRCEDRRAGARS
ncbi:subtilisin family serine protease [Kibdelosporangium phytohabitans]|uniref:Peptidase S8/S53 domain-containing protein n=1 Tax=Kibdelosporangium phytohabitans TaxID=860235 RepID=A0A0N9I8Q5_9PSEU|nr:hypothetical protein AOZ06_40485 [Kibdelosporangium phytohabitans]MBE1463865.1 subtilisin family serine protease [Kibdelosporangium phytohabitans]